MTSIIDRSSAVAVTRYVMKQLIREAHSVIDDKRLMCDIAEEAYMFAAERSLSAHMLYTEVAGVDIKFLRGIDKTLQERLKSVVCMAMQSRREANLAKRYKQLRLSQRRLDLKNAQLALRGIVYFDEHEVCVVLGSQVLAANKLVLQELCGQMALEGCRELGLIRTALQGSLFRETRYGRARVASYLSR